MNLLGETRAGTLVVMAVALSVFGVGCDNLLGPPEDAVTVQVTTCSGKRDIAGRVDVTIGGTVRAHWSVKFVTVTGYADDQWRIGMDSLGFMDKGDVEAFTITGRFTTSPISAQTTLKCTAEVSYNVD